MPKLTGAVAPASFLVPPARLPVIIRAHLGLPRLA